MYNTPAYHVARGLGWFSLALGAAELLTSRGLSRSLGARNYDAPIRIFGIREIVTGIGILTQKNPSPWVWARFAGDLLDMGTLLSVLGRGNPRRGTAMTAFFSVAAVTALDYLCAHSLSEKMQYQRLPRRDYSSRSGFAKSPKKMRGVARAGA